MLKGEFDRGFRSDCRFRTHALAQKVAVGLGFFAAIDVSALPIEGKANGIHEGGFAAPV